ncbi:amino acid permease [Photorhabdus laumondii subsp. laumondii]|uniref:Photorhabdus luminescens subsp. laumondii TTO1 complete genome segment 8/17 n=2 Tax=Photorhabdus laumondii subsp. laumondii TaxID=141679 RepID=Q7N4Z8_PHOLL|nr:MULTISPECIES: amino acid permease [Photorhabdus]AXG47268.1 arginine:ornithine antiporter [Photorhabdus laumondii subsp. laumondii]KTL61749.1 arginine:ornithine antiporter [Photorhabdus laumondii subsp. laumondii]MCC8386470.1 amino acid permease [Photorhabdus laumondii]MCC8415597.1 amino acid permease [Photorhabdus laumondii]NDK94074.1 amino acid permease [Photorhabdus laumondii subsp. laumondii]
MEKKLGLTALTALVLSSMVGAGVFSLPQNMAEIASPAALMIGWGITSVGILFLAIALLLLSRLRPDLDGGIFTYAKEGFGELIGFCSAWGYWLCAVVANVSYLVIVFAALSFFTDKGGIVIFGDGNTWQSLLGESILLWFVHWLVLRGVQTAAGINKLATMAKLLPLGAFIILAAIAFKMDIFHFDFKGIDLGVPVWQQVKDTMLITLWVFIGIEGAVVVSARAKKRTDVGIATMLAVVAALTIYILVTLLSLGLVPRPELAAMRNPSMANLMVGLVGSAGEIIIAAGLIVSVCGAYLSWTIMAAEVPFIAAQHGSFPKVFNRQNRNNAPSSSLWFTNGAVQLSLVLIWLSGSNYNSLLTIASEMILVPYFLVGAFLLKVAFDRSNKGLLLIAVGACIYGIWLLYASGLMNLLLSVVLYAPGLIVFLYARRQNPQKNSLHLAEKLTITALLITAIPATGLLIK